MIDGAIDELTPIVGTTGALAAVGLDRASWYRRHRQSPRPERPDGGSDRSALPAF
jgi:putative transposase